MILVTTSHRPSQRTRSFTKDLSSVFPNSVRVTRGKKTIDDLVTEAYRSRVSFILVVGEKRGNPSLLNIYRVDSAVLPPRAVEMAVILLKGVRLSREIPDSQRVYNPRTIGVDYDGCSTDECFELADVLLTITSKASAAQPDVKILLEDRECIHMEFHSSTGHRVGPVIRVSRVVLYK
ncbi:Brix domain-containing protein [Desulfurococcus mucosus]|uniref:Probable Brix domain-containing ribosomal biogenesis protein n=1 Tax=Desulfurococcus mucosus (strain ATCC 35584 / DSM 2162 / JCM 9187 / O7/1) TaxID=765177 RepID=E8R7E1_DESM0|nr:Brix domain-containing protein [Desulfurococcus mucosus]ADV65606.1 Brix domain protein [Desulfurococcus mucosus DSM 2162]